MKESLLFALAIGLVLACQQEKTTSVESTTDPNHQESKQERNKRIVLARMHGFETGNVDSVIRAENTVVDFIDRREGSVPKKGIQNARAGLLQLMRAFPDYKGTNFMAVAEGDDVLVYGEWSGTWKNDFLGQKATGKSFKTNDVAILKLNSEGKVLEHHGIQPFVTIAKQVGMRLPEHP